MGTLPVTSPDSTMLARNWKLTIWNGSATVVVRLTWSSLTQLTTGRLIGPCAEIVPVRVTTTLPSWTAKVSVAASPV